MKRVQLGKSDLMVSQMALGCLPFGNTVDQETAFQFLDYYREQGGNFLDTSNNYSFWVDGCTGDESETALGNWFKARGNRNDIILATKVGARPTDREKLMANSGTAEGWVKYSEGLTRKAIISSVEQSLKRLQTDYIDLFYAHIDHRENSLEETLEAFDSLVKSGKVKNIGCSNYATWRMVQGKNISRKNGWAEYAAIQQFHSYFQARRHPKMGIAVEANEELFDYIQANRDITLLAYTPLLWGSYVKPEKYNDTPMLQNFVSPDNDKRREALTKIAEDKGATVHQIIYAWMMHRNPPVVPLVAVSSMDQLKENLDSVKIELSDEDMAFLNDPCL